MKKTFLLMTADYAIYGLGVFGATAFMITVLALCGMPVTWWIGALCAVPGWLLVHGLYLFIYKSIVDEVPDTPGNMEIEEEADGCRFHEGGKCTFGDGLPGCAKDEAYQRGFEDGRHRGLLEQELKHRMAAFCDVSCIRIISCEDSSVHYLEFPDGLRLISQKGKYVGWYVSGEEGGGKDA